MMGGPRRGVEGEEKRGEGQGRGGEGRLRKEGREVPGDPEKAYGGQGKSLGEGGVG